MSNNFIKDSHFIRDAVLTEKGKSQCSNLKSHFPYYNDISIVMSSPLRRAIQTASFSFGPIISRSDGQFLLVPLAQEVSAKQCDIGHRRAELEEQLPELLKGQNIGFDPVKIDFSMVEDGWNSKATTISCTLCQDGSSYLLRRSKCSEDCSNIGNRNTRPEDTPQIAKVSKIALQT